MKRPFRTDIPSFCTRFTDPNVRFGSLADIGVGLSDVRFTPETGHAQPRHTRLLSAKSGSPLRYPSARKRPIRRAYSGLARALIARTRSWGMTGLARKVVFDGISPRDGLTAPEMTTIAAWGKRL